MNPAFDAHAHIWEHQWEHFIVGTARAGRYAQRDLLLALMDRHGVERACVLAACNPENPRNNEFIAELCRAQPDRFVMFSEIRLADSARDELLEKTIKEWPALGFRYMIPKDEQPAKWTGSADTPFWDKVNARGLLVAFNASAGQAAALRPLIERYPAITWLLDHMARPRYDIPAMEYNPVLDLATFPNVYVKISGFYAFTAHRAEYPYLDLSGVLQKLVMRFGSQRLLWGSDAPPVLDFSSYEQSYACLNQLLPAISPDDLRQILGGTAARIFRLGFSR